MPQRQPVQTHPDARVACPSARDISYGLGYSGFIYASKRIKLFRPDACEHSVTRVVGGSVHALLDAVENAAPEIGRAHV